MVAGTNCNPAETKALLHEGVAALTSGHISMLSTMGQIGRRSGLCISVKLCLRQHTSLPLCTQGRSRTAG